MLTYAKRGVQRALHVFEVVGADDPGDCRLFEVGFLRFIQHVNEEGERKNPDSLVGDLLSEEERTQAREVDMSRIRGIPFYHYLLARTRHYDRCLLGAVDDGFRQVVLFGSGTDTRAYRFEALLAERGVSVVETDLPHQIAKKEELIGGRETSRHVAYHALDLEDVDYDRWAASAGIDLGERILFVAEGMSPYVSRKAMKSWLTFIARSAPGSRLAYDFKSAGRAEMIVRSVRRDSTFRMPFEPDAVMRFHERRGLAIKVLAWGPGLMDEHLGYTVPRPFEADGVLVGEVRGA